MAEDEISGLSAEITGDTTGLQAAFERAAGMYRAFDQKYGRLTVQITANVAPPSQQAVAATARAATEATARGGTAVAIPTALSAPTRQQAAVLREQTTRLLQAEAAGASIVPVFRAPSGAPGGIGGRFISPAQAASLTPQLDQALKTHDAQLATEVNAASQTARSNVRQSLVPIISRPQIAVPVANQIPEEEIRAQAQSRANALGRAVQFPTAAGIGRVFPTGRGGPVGAEGVESIGGVPLPPGARAFTRGNPQAEEEAARFRAENIQLRQAAGLTAPGGAWRNTPQAQAGNVSLVPIPLLNRMRELERSGPQSRETIERIKASIQQRGLDEPLGIDYSVADRAASLTEGHHRLIAAQELGYTALPAHVMRREGPLSGRSGKLPPLPVEQPIEPDEFGYVKGNFPPSRIFPPTRGIRGAQEAGAAPGLSEIVRSQAARITELEGQLGRGRPVQPGALFDPRLAATGSQFRAPAGARGAAGEAIGGRVVAAPTDTPAQQALRRVQTELTQNEETLTRARRTELTQTQQFLQQIVRLTPRQQIETAQTASLQRPAPGGAVQATELLRQAITGSLLPAPVYPAARVAPIVRPAIQVPVAAAGPAAPAPVTEEHLRAFANVPYGGRKVGELPREQQIKTIGSLLASGVPVPQVPRPLEEVAATGLPTAGEALPERAAQLPEIAEARAQRVTTAGEARVGSLRSTISSLFFTISGARGKVAELEDQQRDFTSKIVANIKEEENITKRLPAEHAAATAAIGEPEKFEKLNAQYELSGKRLGELRGQLPALREGLAGVNKELGALNTGGSALAASFAGGVIGGLAFSVAMQGVTAVVGLAAKALDPAIERVTGFTTLTNSLTDALSDQSRALKGNTELAVAASFAQSGLSESVAASIRPLIEQRTSLEAGGKALQDQIDQINAASQLQNQLRLAGTGQAVGFGQTPGAIPGISTGIGGFLNTPLFQTPGAIEQLARLTPQGAAQQRAIGGAAIGGGAGILGGALAGGVAGGIAGGGVFSLPAAGIGAILGGLAGAGIGAGTANGLPSIGLPGISGNPADFQRNLRSQAQTGQAAQDLSVFTLAIKDLDDAAKRGSPNVRDLGTAISGSTNQSQIDQTQKLLEALKVPEDQRENLKQAGFVLQNAFGGVQNVRQATQFFQGATRGAAIPAPQEALAQLREQTIPARQFQVQAQAAAQRDQLQAQIAIARAAQPFLPAGVTVPGGLSAVSSQITALIGNSIKGIDTIQAQRIEAGRVQIQNITSGLGPQAQAAAGADFTRIQQLGGQAAALQTGITQEQVGLQTAQYNEQIRQQKLALTDLAQITGRIGSIAGDNLGIYEKQAIVLGRQSAELTLQSQQLQLQSQSLQLQLAQRQLNFQVAVAGFAGGPGESPEEAALRQEAAKQQAAFAQKQLDIQKEQLTLGEKQVALAGRALPISFRIEDIQHNRDYITAVHALSLLERARQVTIDTAGAQEALQRIQAEIDASTADLNTYLQAGEQLIQGVISDAAGFIQQYKQSAETLEQSAAAFFSGTSTAFSSAFNTYLKNVTGQIINVTSQLAGVTTGGTPSRGFFAQTGYLGSVSNDTTFHAGEAGTEAVAVLAQPRDVTVHPTGAMQMTVGQAKGQTVGIVKNPPKFAEGYVGYIDHRSISETNRTNQVNNTARYATGYVGYVDRTSRLSDISRFSDIAHHAKGYVGYLSQRFADGYVGSMPAAPRYAEGYFGSMGSEPHYAAGFAGITSPQTMFSSSSGVTVNITITGNTIRSDEDIDKLAAKVSDIVTQRFGRTSSLLGFRLPSGS